jgi:hypothetical protein
LGWSNISGPPENPQVSKINGDHDVEENGEHENDREPPMAEAPGYHEFADFLIPDQPQSFSEQPLQKEQNSVSLQTWLNLFRNSGTQPFQFLTTGAIAVEDPHENTYQPGPPLGRLPDLEHRRVHTKVNELSSVDDESPHEILQLELTPLEGLGKRDVDVAPHDSAAHDDNHCGEGEQS